MSLHFFLFIFAYTPTESHTVPHTHKLREKEASHKQDMWQLLLFFGNLLKEIYVSKQNKVNPQAWIFGGCGRKQIHIKFEQCNNTAAKNVALSLETLKEEEDFNHRV